MKSSWRWGIGSALGGVLLLGATTVVSAQQAAPAAPAQRTWIDDAKNPVKWFKWGADERARNEYLGNVGTFNENATGNEVDFQRYRTRVWGTVTPFDQVDVNFRLVNEARHFTQPTHGWNENYSTIFFDNLNVSAKGLLGDGKSLKSTLTVGRQDIIMGDGWLVLDGTPLDGSRSIYFDAARLSLEAAECKSTLDLVFIQQYALIDEWLPAIDDQEWKQMEQDERGVIVYLTNKMIEKTQVDGYFIYKHDDKVLANGDQGDIYTFGSRITRDFSENIFGRVEGAYQFGNRNNPAVFGAAAGSDVSAYGLNSKLGYKFNDAMKNQVYAVYEYMSGDDQRSETNESFDPLWGRWPQWSELWAAHGAAETRPGETTNIQRLGLGWEAEPAKGLTLKANYYALFGNENPYANTTRNGLSLGDDSFRGHLMTGLVQYKFNQFLAAHVLGEYFLPGNFYSDPSRDNAAYVRVEAVFTF